MAAQTINDVVQLAHELKSSFALFTAEHIILTRGQRVVTIRLPLDRLVELERFNELIGLLE